MKTNMGQILPTLISILPRHALESGDCYAASKTDLVAQLSKRTGINIEASTALLDMVEAILDSESTLDQDKLKQGEWQFVSYAAQLMGLSRLATLAEPSAKDVPDDFWAPHKLGDHAHRSKAAERLESYEQNRWDSMQKVGGTALPIRLGHIAWCFIKLDGKFLFHRKEEHVTRKLGEYGPIGGKMNEEDIPASYAQAERIRLINADSLMDSKYNEVWLNTIKREIYEEVAESLMGESGLEYGHDYSITELKPRLNTFSFCRGTDLIFSVAQYWFKLFTVDLTLPGYLKLKQNMRLNKRLHLASVEKMENQMAGDVKLDIKALHEHYPGGFTALAEKLDLLPDSFSQEYKSKKGVIVPVREGQALEVATTAKTVVKGMESLSQQECDLLLGLAAHARGWTLNEVPEGIHLHCDGWVDASGNSDIRDRLLHLIGKATSYFDMHDSRLFRLSVSPDKMYLNESAFSFSVNENDPSEATPMAVSRDKLETPIGCIHSDLVEISIKIEDAQNVHVIALKEADVAEDGFVKCEKRAKEQTWAEYAGNFNKAHRNKVKIIGLRYLLKVDQHKVVIACQRVS